MKITLTENANRIVEELVQTGLFGKSTNEAIERIVCRWITENIDKLNCFGINV